MRRGAAAVSAVLCLLSVCVPAFCQEGGGAGHWDEATLELAAALPVQEGGRVKPLSTSAAFQLLRLNGRRRCATHPSVSFNPLDRLGAAMGLARKPEGRIISATEWLMDTLLFPGTARHYPVFLVEDTEALAAAGLNVEGKEKRDRLSYDELAEGREALARASAEYGRIPERQRTYAQTQVVNLAQNMAEYEALLHYFDFARQDFSQLMAGMPWEEGRFSEVLRDAGMLRAAFALLQHGSEALERLGEAGPEAAALEQAFGQLDAEARAAKLDQLRALLGHVEAVGRQASSLALIPPAGAERTEWFTPADLVDEAFFSEAGAGDELDLLKLLEDIWRTSRDPVTRGEGIARFHAASAGLAQARGEYGTIPLEVSYYRYKLLYRSLIFYIAAFVLVALLWARPNSRILNVAAPGMLSIATLLLVAGIVLRCVIRGRPPVTTLYETILFTTAVAVVVAGFIEFLYRGKIALSIAAVLGVVGLFLANKYEAREAVDTMPSMVAVLDTNFWLSTHVTTIIMGYAAGLLAAALGHVYLFAKTLGVRRSEPAFYRSLDRMIYGVLCFGLLFATVGTVFGGIWAAESWGRFWGWDPKENGALMIVLWLLAVVHARLGGYLKGFGTAVCAVLLGMIIVFSWWGVNLLGVGLHSYGFTSGILNVLLLFYGIETAVLLLAGAGWWRRQPA